MVPIIGNASGGPLTGLTLIARERLYACVKLGNVIGRLIAYTEETVITVERARSQRPNLNIQLGKRGTLS